MNDKFWGFLDRYVIAMKNGDLDAKGLLTKLITNQGSTESFKVIKLLSRYILFFGSGNGRFHLNFEIL